MDISVRNNQIDKRFQADVSGHLAFLEYETDKNVMILIHTEVPPELEGKGIGGRLARAALDHALANRLKVIPQCPFVAKYIERHQEYTGLVESKLS